MNDINAEYAALSMGMGREKVGLTKGEYLQKAKELPKLASKNLVLRCGRKYFDELTTTGIQEVEVLALLLQMEDEQLNEWRQAMDKIRARNTKAVVAKDAMRVSENDHRQFSFGHNTTM